MAHLEVTRDGSITTLTMNRPEVLNAMNRALSIELHGAVQRMSADDWILNLLRA